MNNKSKIMILPDVCQEVHFPEGNSTVAVCWNIHTVTKTIKGSDGLTYKAEVQERRPKAEPYIDFVALREYEKGEFVKDEDSPVVGGLSTVRAKEIAEELIRAAQYIENKTYAN